MTIRATLERTKRNMHSIHLGQQASTVGSNMAQEQTARSFSNQPSHEDHDFDSENRPPADTASLPQVDLEWLRGCHPKAFKLYNNTYRARAPPPSQLIKLPNCPVQDRLKLEIKKVLTHDLFNREPRFLIDYENPSFEPSWVHWLTLKEIMGEFEVRISKLSDYLLHLMINHDKRFMQLKKSNLDILDYLTSAAEEAFQEVKRSRVRKTQAEKYRRNKAKRQAQDFSQNL